MQKLPRHAHTGTDSDRVSYEDLRDRPRPLNLRHYIHAMFETAGRYNGGTTGTSAARSFDTNGLNLTSGVSSGSYAYNELPGDVPTLSLFDTPLVLDFVVNWPAEANGTHRAFVVVGSVGGGGSTFTEKHFGFEWIANATNKLRGTVADGTTRTTTDLDLTGVTLSDDNIYSAEYYPRQGVVFYVNGRLVGRISDGTLLPTGVPTDTNVWSEQKSIRNNAGTTVNTLYVRWLNIHVPLEGSLSTKL